MTQQRTTPPEENNPLLVLVFILFVLFAFSIAGTSDYEFKQQEQKATEQILRDNGIILKQN